MKTGINIREIYNAAVKAVDPYLLVKERLGEIYSALKDYEAVRISLLGFGKASFLMTKAVEESIDRDLITNSIVITKYGHALRRKSEDEEIPASQTLQLLNSRLRIYEAGHPVPDENGLMATEEAIETLRKKDRDTLVVCLVSGGGSALLVSPYEGIILAEKQKVTELLLKAGADITEINAVRKHISRVKGGRLAEIIHPSGIISLMVSDVPGDSLDVIASGPTAPDSSTFSDALAVLQKHGILDRVPRSVINMLVRGRNGELPETLKQGDPVFDRVRNIIIGNNLRALNAAKNRSESLGLKTVMLSHDIRGEARDAGSWLAEKALEISSGNSSRPICLISGGETTVTVRGKGKGGRNIELALGFAIKIEDAEGITLLSAGTDGTDGPTDAAGAVADGKTISRARSLGLDPVKYLEENDSYNFFRQIDSLFITGPTGTNVMDIQIMLIE
jgi:glycerate-2-kinase